MKIEFLPFMIKLSFAILIFVKFPFPLSIGVYVATVLIYPYIIAKVMGVHVMPAMDLACFFGDLDKSRVNFMSFTIFDKTKYSRQYEKFS